MVFDIKGKVAIVTGSASGIGFKYVQELLKSGAKAVTIADVNEEQGNKALKDIEKEFGPNRVIFVKTDVCSKEQIENAFKETIANFNNVDILINNAGILNDACWEKEIIINVTGTAYGTLLALEEYLPKYKGGDEGVIVNISSIAGLDDYPLIPIYTGTKFAVLGMSRAFGNQYHYERTKVKVITICPGVTDTPLISEMPGRTLGPNYENLRGKLKIEPMQPPEFVGKEVIEVIKKAQSGSCWLIEAEQSARELIFPTRHQLETK